MSAGAGAPRPVTPLSILAARLARAAGTADGALSQELHELAALAGGLDPYLSACTTPPSPALSALAEATAAHDWSSTGVEQEMLSGHVEGALLAMLVHATRATRVLDVGMFTGYSALALAEALPAGGEVIACEIDPDVAAFAQAHFPAGVPIDVRVGPALDTLATLTGPFDLVFLDADKAGYLAYLDAVLPLLAPHGLVCVDNTLMQGLAYGVGEPTANGDAVRAFNDAVAADPRVEQVLLPLRDGVTLIRRVA